ncbi:MAG: gamma-glutamyl-gamma-aminobutyrate hydrolase family protein [Lachnospiraceae bacterium]|jgi:putative glutamine amidotransferase|nr:gamma-glutamyl-gamma-aminobutyrate hydrolase family protein [Lachnospiraceae bacterium]
MISILIAGIPEKVGNYVEALEAAGMKAVVSLEWQGDPDFSGIDGLLLPGGADIDPERYGEELNGSRDIDRELDAAQFAVLEAFLTTGKPVLGICKGHQILNVFFGGSLIQNLEDPDPHREEKVHMTHAVEGSWLAGLYGTDFPTNSWHHQAVKRLGDGFSVIQMSEDGIVEAIAHDRLPLLSLQWHPERMCCSHSRPDTVDGSLVFSYFRELCEGVSHRDE